VDHFRTRRVLLETEPELSVNVDGELVAKTPEEFSVAANALQVIVPKTSDAAQMDH
jgi:diacylglycerol kinase family enzyme